MVLATFAYCGSGQDTLADAICESFNFSKISSGDIIRNIAKNRGITQTRENLSTIRKQLDSSYGREYIPKLIVRHILSHSKTDNFIITGLRTRQEYEVFSQAFFDYGFELLFVRADEKIRMSRILARGEVKDPKTEEEYFRQMEKETLQFDYDDLKKARKPHYDFWMNMSFDDFSKNKVEYIIHSYPFLYGYRRLTKASVKN